MGLGIVLIIAGVLTVELGAQKAQHHSQTPTDGQEVSA